MKKRTITIVSISLVLAILAVSIIATFPTYLFEEDPNVPTTNSNVQNDNIKPSQGEDIGVVGDDENGIQSVLPDLGIVDDDATQIPSITFKTLATANGVKLISANNAFEKGTEFNAKKLGIFSKDFYRARHYVQKFAKNYAMYEITAKNSGRDVQPIDTARIVIDIPKKYNLDNIEVYYLLDNGVQKLSAVIDKETRTATVGFMQSGVYILIENDKADNDISSSDNASSDNASSNNTSSNITSTESEDTSSSTSSNTNSSNITDSSEENNSSNTNSDSSSTESDPNQDSMEGWTPWY